MSYSIVHFHSSSLAIWDVTLAFFDFFENFNVKFSVAYFMLEKCMEAIFEHLCLVNWLTAHRVRLFFWGEKLNQSLFVEKVRPKETIGFEFSCYLWIQSNIFSNRGWPGEIVSLTWRIWNEFLTSARPVKRGADKESSPVWRLSIHNFRKPIHFHNSSGLCYLWKLHFPIFFAVFPRFRYESMCILSHCICSFKFECTWRKSRHIITADRAVTLSNASKRKLEKKRSAKRSEQCPRFA